MKRKHFLLSLICLLLLSLSMFTLTACGGNEPSHTHVYDKQVVNDTFKASDATCEDKAEYYYSCSCGEKGTETFEYGSALGHAYGEWVSVGNGQHKKTCANDNSHIITENCFGGTATCTEKAKCSVCSTEYGEANGHDYDEVVTEPTCTEQGYTTYTCHCNYSYIADYVDALGHTEVIDNAVASTCTETGLTEGKHCSVCEEVLIAQEVVEATGHDYDEEVTEPTCTEQGYTTYTCHCKHSYIDDYVDALGHTEVIDNAVASTCTETGLTEGKHCSVCEEVLIAQEVVEATGHDYDEVVTEPTCTEQGYTTYTCHCNDSYIDNYVEALGHTEVVDNAVNATFSSPGLTAGSHCSVCNEVIVAQIEIPSLGLDADSEQGIVASPEYSDVEEGVSYRYSYSLNIKENDSFVLTTLTIGSDETYSLNYSSGTISNIGNEIHELIFDDGRDSMYIRFIDNKFEFCKRDGSSWDKEKYERPEGVTTIDLVPRLGNSTYGYYDLANNVHGESMQELYRRMFYACEAFVNNSDDIQSTNGFYILDTIDLGHYIINVNEVISTWKVFIVENPRYYWLSNSLTVDGSNLKFCIDEAYSKADYRAQCDVAIDNMLEECNALINEGMSELEIALTVHDFIINRMDYAYESDGVTPQDDIWAHNMIGCAKYNLGVCESFAETFMFLCRLNDVEAIIVTGTANNESHAWNIVKIDGVWYGVDTTWDETNETGLISYNCFGMSKQYCDSTHNADSFDKIGVNYLYQLPDMSENSIELVDLLKNGEFIGTYVSIDKAFEYMTDQNADYTLQLYSYTLQGPLLISSPSIIHNIYSMETPDVKSITIKGHHEDLGNGYITCTSVDINNSLTLFADTLILYDISLTTPSDSILYIQNNCLEIMGQLNHLKIPVIGNIEDGETSKIICNIDTHGSLEFWEKVNVCEMDVYETVTFREQTTVIHLKALVVSVYGGNLNVQNFYGLSKYCTIGLRQMASANIQNLYSDSNKININLQFGKLEEFPQLTLGNVESNVEITLDGTVHYLVTDIFGNEIDRYIEEAKPYNVIKPIAYLSQISDFEKVKIFFANQGEKTSLYLVDSNGDIVAKPFEVIDGLIIMDGIIVHYDGTATILNIPEGVKSIDDLVFRSCTSLTKVIIPDSVTNIGKNAFMYCRSLTSLVIGKNVENIDDGAFMYCDRLVEVYNKSNLNIVAGSSSFGYAGYYALKVYEENYVSKLTTDSDGYIIYTDADDKILVGYVGNEYSLTLPNGITSIHKYAFYDCTSLINVEIPNSVTSIGDSAFESCYFLTNVVISNSIKSIGKNAFRHCGSLTSIIIPNTVTSIGEGAFYNCTSLTNIVIADSVTNIGFFAFYSCASLTNVYYTGTAENWSKISIGSNNSDLTSATIYYYIENVNDLPADNGNYWHYVDGVPTPWTTTEE